MNFSDSTTASSWRIPAVLAGFAAAFTLVNFVADAAAVLQPQHRPWWTWLLAPTLSAGQAAVAGFVYVYLARRRGFGRTGAGAIAGVAFATTGLIWLLMGSWSLLELFVVTGILFASATLGGVLLSLLDRSVSSRTHH